jgi:hypothetical protein
VVHRVLVWLAGPIHPERAGDRAGAAPFAAAGKLPDGRETGMQTVILAHHQREFPPLREPDQRAATGSVGRQAMIEFKGSHFEREVVLWGVRWYVAYPISYRQLEEMMEERGVEVDHSSLNRWALKYAPLLDRAFRARKRRVGGSWRMDETYVRIRGQWKYLYRAVDKAGTTVDFLLTDRRNRKAVSRHRRLTPFGVQF